MSEKNIPPSLVDYMTDLKRKNKPTKLDAIDKLINCSCCWAIYPRSCYYQCSHYDAYASKIKRPVCLQNRKSH